MMPKKVPDPFPGLFDFRWQHPKRRRRIPQGSMEEDWVIIKDGTEKIADFRFKIAD
jgi:hypothetical protein